MMWALIVEGLVRETTDVDPEGRYHPDLTWVPCGSNAREGWLFDGLAFSAPPEAPAPDLSARRATLLTAVDAKAEAERQRWITPGAGQAMTYQRKIEEAYRLEADANPQADAYPMLAATLGLDGKTLADVAAVVLAQDAMWTQIGARIERQRLTLKRDVADAADAAALAAIDIDAGWPEMATEP